MADPISVLVRRGAIVEAVHRVHAVAVRDGAVVDACGDPGLVSFLRSSAKPFQALPLARAREDLDERDLAIASASHLGRPEHVAAVEALLAKVPASADELECGAEPTKLRHNCSGKHAGMLALCAARGWPSDAGTGWPAIPSRRAAARRSQRRRRCRRRSCRPPSTVAASSRSRFRSSAWRSRSRRLERLEAGAAVARAMRAHPELVRGGGATDTVLMQRLSGLDGEGRGRGALLRVRPGRARGRAQGGGRRIASARPRARRVPRPTRTVEVPDLAVAPLSNSRGERVGEDARTRDVKNE